MNEEYLYEIVENFTREIINLFEIKIPIINIENIVEKIGGKVITNYDLWKYSDGKLKKINDDSFIIEIPNEISDEYKNFIISKNLGILFLTMGYISNNNLWYSFKNNEYVEIKNIKEKNCVNRFASSFLMPKNEYIKYLNKIKEKNKYSKNIEEYFNVGAQRAYERGVELKLLKW